MTSYKQHKEGWVIKQEPPPGSWVNSIYWCLSSKITSLSFQGSICWKLI